MDTQEQVKEEEMAADEVEETTTPAKPKRQRATKEEMAKREQDILRAISSEDEPVTIEFVMKRTGLSQIRAATLIRRLTDEGKVEVVGKRGRQLLLRPGSGQPQPKVVEKQPTVTGVRELSSVDVNDVLAQLHIGLGNELRVAGLHLIEGSKPVIDLRTRDGATLRVTVVNNAA